MRDTVRCIRLTALAGAAALICGSMLSQPAFAGSVNFSDGFAPSASTQWNNFSGSWTASNGQYYAQTPSGGPSAPAITELPFDLTNNNLTLSVGVNALGDGGIVFDGNGTDSSGLMLVLGGFGYGQGTRGGTAGTSAYWVDLAAGTNPPILAEADNVFTPGNNYTIKVTVNDGVYSMFVNGSSTATLTLDSTAYSSGMVGLYDDQPNIANGGYGAPQSFSNFSVSGTTPVPLPAALWQLLAGAFVLGAAGVGRRASVV